MSESHGPALVIHNNSKFSDEDFANIQKLASGTKQNKHLKIGKFGIGFCSVYHITDVPSFISRERLYIFDPTLHHLRKAVKNPSQPGKKVNYLTKFIQHSKQMEPYEGLFGFKKNAEYNGTMFRLPFRTSASELSTTCYSRSTIDELLRDIQESGDQLLLFLHNVEHVTVQRFDAGMKSPKVLYELRKSALQPSPPLDNASIITLESRSGGRSTYSPSSWLVATCDATYKRKPAVASVACLLSSPNSSKPTYTVDSSLVGEIFCFLPLSQSSGLPVHVSCNFAVINNRRGIWTTSHAVTAACDPEVQWNIFLMEKVIPVAYSRLLFNLKTMIESNVVENYNFYCLWPLISKLELKNPWEKCVNSFYTSVVFEKLFYSESTSQWLSLQESKFLDPDLLGQPDSLHCVLDVIFHLNLPLVYLPTSYKSHLKLSRERLTEKEFVELFFTNLPRLKAISGSRNDVILYMLEAYDSQYDYRSDLVRLLEKKLNHVCIPTAPDGSVLRRCSEVVSPKASFAGLFDKSDHRFPLGVLTDRHLAMTALQHVGMMHSTLSWDLLIDRAESVEGMMRRDKVKALERVKLILNTLSTCVEGEPPNSGTTIDSINFLPVMKKPENYPLIWYGGNFQLLPGRKLVLSETYTYSRSAKWERIAGSQVAFLCEELPKHGGCGYVKDYKTRELLQLRSCPSLHEVIAHLKEIITRFNSRTSQLEWITCSCRDIYQFIETNIQKSSDSAIKLEELRGIACIWNGQNFLDVSCVAHNWKLENGPYLYTSPPALSSKEKLSLALGIKENFTSQDARKALEMMKSHSGSQPVDKSCEMLLTEIISIFQNLSPEELKDLNGCVYLPDRKNVLHLSSNLVFNDVAWAPMDESNVQVSEKLPRDLAISLGVRLVRSKILEQYVSKKAKHFRGVSFGQHEELTRRIQTIIRDYPFDITVLKELLQNADDAKANKMYVILDKRTHGKSSVLSEEWQKLQGPALLIWNDSTFTEADLQGIQELGLGSKRNEAETIGQYGIGFNVVYHLTDCPSFITNGDTLCVLDPHCKYAPEASDALPGARYDDLKRGFWKEFADMSSAYLQDGVNDMPKEFLGGSLFRFPIRHDYSMVRSSKIVDSLDTPLSAENLSRWMLDWMHMMKQAMFFLNHVTEIKYIEIDRDTAGSSVKTKFHFKIETTKSDSSLGAFQEAVSEFTAATDCRSCVILYPLTVTEVDTEETGKGKQEKWLIQQGVGDIKNEGQYWQYVKTVKPSHGIAAPLLPPKTHYGESEYGQLFCFLPLPVHSSVPVHINGSFILHSNRRNLWVNASRDGGLDDRSRWNACLFKAIASSYADFLIQARDHYLKSTYNNWTQALQDMHNYYYLFPRFPVTDIEKKWDSFPCKVYGILVESNAEVLCVLVSHGQQKGAKAKLSVEWHPLISSRKDDQVYFWSNISGPERKIIHPVFQSIRMKITSAPPRKMDLFNKVMAVANGKEISNHAGLEVVEKASPHSDEADKCKKIPAVSPSSVFEYYTKHSPFSSSLGMQPSPIKKTSFKDAKMFLLFVKYLMRIKLESDSEKGNTTAPPTGDAKGPFGGVNSPSRSNSVEVDHDKVTSDSMRNSFPDPPNSHFLLLSADGILRKFDDDHKILHSRHFKLFPSHLDMFLHPDLQVINFNRAYFISQDDVEDKNAVDQVLSIFEGTLPHEMHEEKVVSGASGVISKDKLTSFWKCFEDDKLLACFLPKILSHWALLHTTDDRLFSTASEVLPSYNPSEPDDLFKRVRAMMMSLKIPFLNGNVVTVAVDDCPALSDRGKILSYFYHANKDAPLTAVLRNTCHIETLIRYFSSAAKPGDAEWVRQISSLPFFEDISGNYLPIVHNGTYTWPHSAIDVGYSTWVRDFNILLVKANASWNLLGSAEQLKISNINAVKLYAKFIFPMFGLLKETERYEHLDHIKRFMYPSAKNYKECKTAKYTSDEECQKISDAKLFIEDLTDLKCIGADYSSLKPISAFCSHKVQVFRVFSDDFETLPEQFQSDDWLEFFKELGLKQVLTKQEYLYLCKKIADESVEHPRLCSENLLQYLFSREIRKLWSGEQEFLVQVSKIAFVYSCDTSSVDWIMPGKCQYSQLVQLNGAASNTLTNLTWTVRPIIQLPVQCLHLYRDQDTTFLLAKLNILTVASVSDTIANLQNINGESVYANEVLFNKYPGHLVAPEKTSLLSVMQENLSHLNSKVHTDEFQASMLDDMQCIPVYCDGSNKDKKKMVLVKPSSVLSSGCLDDDGFHPYLHRIPVELRSLRELLAEVGIKSRLEPHHMQIVLEKIFCLSEGAELDPNAKECVKKAMEFLFSSLATSTSEVLTPLYLPDTSNQLKLSTTMLYGDTPSYFGHMRLNLSGTPYSHFDTIEDSHGVTALDMCRLLPEKVRPLGMSEKCKQIPNVGCISVEHSDLSRSIQSSLKDKSNTLAVVKVYNKFIPNTTNTEDLEHLVESFFSSLEVVTKQNLQSQIVLRESDQVIGHMKSDFYLESCDVPYILYIDEEFDDEDDIVTEITEHLYIAISRKSPTEVPSTTKTRLLSFIMKYLKAKPSKKQHILMRYRIEIGIGNRPEHAKFSLALGEEIPESYHHRLDQHPHNIFRSMEYVGYEDKENHIIVAQVAHLVKSENTNQLTTTYHIYTHKKDEEGKDVSILCLYKFLTGTKKTQCQVPLTSEDEGSALVPYSEESEVMNLRRSQHEGNLADIKESISKELKEIWKLDEALRNKAVKRLYLKWHPDKNLDDTERAQEVFQFLLDEIECLKRTDAAEDDDDETDPNSDDQCTTSRGGAPPDFNFDMWNRVARGHRDAFVCEEEHTRKNPRSPSPPFERTNEQRPEEGERWARQAETDYKVLCAIHSTASASNGYGNVCFMAHQVAEKALKGGVYALCGMDGRGLTDHNLTRHAYALETEQIQGLHQHSIPLEGYYLETRYPNRWPGHMDTPADHYDSDDADKAKDHAKEILDAVKTLLQM